MKMIKVKSSNIRSVGYIENLFQLVVEFKATDRSKAKVFTYEDVSPAEYKALMNAGSIGRHFGAYIKNVKEGRPINCAVVAGDNGDELHVKGKSKPTTSTWISVDDAMPEVGEFVLVYRPKVLVDDHTDKPIRCARWMGDRFNCHHQPNEWMRIKNPESWNEDLEKRQLS